MLAAAACWFIAAALLWRTEVPSSLSLPDLDPRDYFTAALDYVQKGIKAGQSQEQITSIESLPISGQS